MALILAAVAFQSSCRTILAERDRFGRKMESEKESGDDVIATRKWQEPLQVAKISLDAAQNLQLVSLDPSRLGAIITGTKENNNTPPVYSALDVYVNYRSEWLRPNVTSDNTDPTSREAGSRRVSGLQTVVGKDFVVAGFTGQDKTYMQSALYLLLSRNEFLPSFVPFVTRLPKQTQPPTLSQLLNVGFVGEKTAFLAWNEGSAVYLAVTDKLGFRELEHTTKLFENAGEVVRYLAFSPLNQTMLIALRTEQKLHMLAYDVDTKQIGPQTTLYEGTAGGNTAQVYDVRLMHDDNGQAHAIWLSSPDSGGGGIKKILYATMQNNTWSSPVELGFIEDDGTSVPQLITLGKNQMMLIWKGKKEPSASVSSLMYALYQNGQWSEASAHPQSSPANAVYFPTVAHDPTSGTFVNWVEKGSNGKFVSYLSQFDHKGQWQPRELNRTFADEKFFCCAIRSLGNGELALAWVEDQHFWVRRYQ